MNGSTQVFTDFINTRVLTDMNSNAEACFDGLPAQTLYDSRSYGPPEPTSVVVTTYPNQFAYNSTAISFLTPFVYLPRRGAFEREADLAVGLEGPCEDSGTGGIGNSSRQRSNGTYGSYGGPPGPDNNFYRHVEYNTNASFCGLADDFGHTPHALIDWMLQDPSYVAQFPDLALYKPGGPSINVNFVGEYPL